MNDEHWLKLKIAGPVHTVWSWNKNGTGAMATA